MGMFFYIANTNLVMLHLTGTTNDYGVIVNPNTNYYPIASISDSYAINANETYIRVLSTASTNPVLLKNTLVDFYFIAIRQAAF